MKKQLELTLSQIEVDLIKEALLSYRKEMILKGRKYNNVDTDKYTLTKVGKNEIVLAFEAKSRNIAYLLNDICEKNNELYLDDE
jgi:hypothetical protein